MINWKVRIQQKWFWITLVPMLFLMYDQVRELIDLVILWDGTDVLYGGPIMVLVEKIIGIVFAVLVLLGIPVDTTTEGYGDSARALTYERPAMNAAEAGMLGFEADGEDE